MIYQIVDKYYVKVGKDFVEVELKYKDNDIDLKPTNNKLENNGNIKYKEINFLNEKSRMLDKYKSKFRENKTGQNDKQKSFRNKSFK